MKKRGMILFSILGLCAIFQHVDDWAVRITVKRDGESRDLHVQPEAMPDFDLLQR